MKNQLEKALRLAKKTGDRIILFDSSKSDYGVVVMGLDEYEKMIDRNPDVRGLTEDELLDRINRDIAVWKSEQDDLTGSDFPSYFRRQESKYDCPEYQDFPMMDDEEGIRQYQNKTYRYGLSESERGSSREWNNEALGGLFASDGTTENLSDKPAGRFNPERPEGHGTGRREFGKGRGWVIPVDRKKQAEEVIEEDRQYLEEVPF